MWGTRAGRLWEVDSQPSPLVAGLLTSVPESLPRDTGSWAIMRADEYSPFELPTYECRSFTE